MKTLILVTIFALMRVSLTQDAPVEAATINSVNISCDPAFVGAQGVSITIDMSTDVDLEFDSQIIVSVPEEASMRFDVANPRSNWSACGVTAGRLSQTGMRCAVRNSQSVIMVLPDTVLAGYPISLSFEEVLNMPKNTAETGSFKIQILSADNEIVLAETALDAKIQISMLTPNPNLSIYTEQHRTTGEVGLPTDLEFEVTPMNNIPAGGGVQIELPKWNPTAQPRALIESFIVAEDKSVECIARAGIGSFTGTASAEDSTVQLECDTFITPSKDFITIKNMFAQTVYKDQPFYFIIRQLRNPMSMSPVALKVTTFSGLSENLNANPSEPEYFYGLIDEGFAPFQAFEPSVIKSTYPFSQIQAAYPTVQENSMFFITFQVDVPVSEGCKIKIQLPRQMQVEPSMGKVMGYGLFVIESETAGLQTQIDQLGNTIMIEDQCKPYTQAGTASNISIQQLLSPDYAKETDDWTITILDKNNQKIAETEVGLTYKPEPGVISDVTLIAPAGKQDVGAIVNLQLQFTPPHRMTRDSRIRVQMPELLPVGCSIASTSSQLDITKPGYRCVEMANNMLEFRSPFRENIEIFSGAEELMLEFENIKLPGATIMITGITIQTYQLDQEDDQFSEYLVDELVAPDLEFFAPDSVMFLFSEVRTPISSVTYSESNFRFQLTAANDVPEDGKIYVQLPPEVTVYDTELVESTCRGYGYLESIICKVEQTVEGDGTITTKIQITKEVNSGLSIIKKEYSFIFEIGAGLLTPISKKSSSSFKIWTTDQADREINYIRKALFITMREGKDLGRTEVMTSNQQVGSIADHTINFITSTPLYNGYYVYVFIPPECEAPFATDLSCTSTDPLIEDLNCRVNGNRVTIEVESANGLMIEMGSQISISLSNIKNPTSTAPTQPYNVSIYSDELHLVADQLTSGEGDFVVMVHPSIITNFYLETQDQRHKALTTVSVNWENSQIYPAETTFVIGFNPEEITPKFEYCDNDCSTVTAGYLDCIFRNSKPLKCYVDNQLRTITAPNAVDYELQSGQMLSLMVTNMILNVDTPITTESWSLTSFIGEMYKIDEVSDGLSFTFDCHFPCLTCDPENTSICLSCNGVQGDVILYEGMCYKECPAGTYLDNFQCELCDETCETCSSTSGIQCTSCDTDSEWPFLNGNLCTSSCEFGFYGNRDTGKCELCKHPCESCVDTEDKCTSCSSANVEKYFFNNQCLVDGCPFGYVSPRVQQGDRYVEDNICRKCSDNCISCEYQTTNCSTCRDTQLMNLLDNSCVDICPPGVTVRQGNQCITCDDNCKTCSGSDVMNCRSCHTNLVLYADDISGLSRCKLNCQELLPDETEKTLDGSTQVAVGGTCQPCQEPCKRCSGTVDHCTECPWTHYFWNFQCVESCSDVIHPRGYEYTPNANRWCVIEGLICKFGYKLNPTGDFCEVDLIICEQGAILNADKTKCVPGSEDAIPYPFLIIACALSIVPFVSYGIARHSRLTSNLIAFVTMIEPFGMITLLIQAKDYGLTEVMWLTALAVLIHWLCNIFMLLVYCNQLSKDSAFKHWQAFNKKTSCVVSVLAAINFKLYRVLFGYLLGRDEFHAVMQDPYVFYRPYTFAGVVSTIFGTLPLAVGCMFGLTHLAPGYQLQMTCLEMLVIEVVLFILTVIEYFRLRGELMVQNDYQKVDRRTIESSLIPQDKGLKVMAGAAEEDAADDFEIDATGAPKAAHRTLHNAKALQQHFVMQGVLNQLHQREALGMLKDDRTEWQIEQLHERDIMTRNLRHCRSHRHLRGPFFGSDDESEEEESYMNFISEPGTPRSKEMLQNGNFVKRMHQLNHAYKARDQYDNCYHTVGFVKPLPYDNSADVACQTNVLEMLGCDDLVKEDPIVSSEHYESSAGSEEGMYDEAAQRLISGVLDKLSDEGTLSDEPRFVRRKRITLSQKRMNEIPEFDIEDIIGEFEIDNKGNNLIIKTKDGKFNDKFGRNVNRRGYLVDEDKNVITKRGIFIFYREEIDEDDEIPAPYCYNKHKKRLFKVEAFSAFQKNQKHEKQQMDPDQYIEQEYQRIKNAHQRTGKQDEPLSREPKVTRESHHGSIHASKAHKDDQDNLLSQIVEPFKPKTKQELLRTNEFAKPRSRAGTGRVRRTADGNETTKSGINLSNLGGDMIAPDMSPNVEQISTNKPEEPVNLSFVQSQYSKSRGKSAKNKQKSSLRPMSVADSSQISDLYRRDMDKLKISERAVKQDEQYLRKLQDMESDRVRQEQMELRTRKFKDRQEGDGFGGAVRRNLKKLKRAAPTNPDETGSGLCLARKKLNQIYGRVRQRFNSQVRTGATAIFHQKLEHHAGGFSPAMQGTDAATGDQRLFRSQLQDEQNQVSQHQTSAILKRSLNHSRRGKEDESKLRELQKIYQDPRGKQVKPPRPGGQSPRRRIDATEHGQFNVDDGNIDQQLSNLRHIIDNRPEMLPDQSSRPNSAFKAHTSEGTIQTNKPKYKLPGDLLQGRFL